MHLLQSKCFREWSSNDTIGDKWVKPKVRLWWGGQAAHQSQSFCKTSFLEIKNMQTFGLSHWRMEANESHQRQINKLINGQLLKLGGHIIPVTITFPGCQALQPYLNFLSLSLELRDISGWKRFLIMIWRTEIIDQAVLKFYILPQIYVALVPLVE